jgi:hypothetical protein
MKAELGLLMASYGFVWIMGLWQGWVKGVDSTHAHSSEKASNDVGGYVIFGALLIVVGVTMAATLTFGV